MNTTSTQVMNNIESTQSELIVELGELQLAHVGGGTGLDIFG